MEFQLLCSVPLVLWEVSENFTSGEHSMRPQESSLHLHNEKVTGGPMAMRLYFRVHGALAPPLSCYSRHYCASIHMHSESFAAIRRPGATHKCSPYQLRTSIDRDLCSGVIAWLLAAIDSVKLLNFHSKGWEHIVAALSCAPLLNYAVL